MSKTFVFGNQPLTAKNVDKFLEDFLEQKLTQDNFLEIQRDLQKSEKERAKLNNTDLIEFVDFAAFLNDQQADGLVYFFNSSESTELQTQRSKIFNGVSSFLQNRLGMVNLDAMAYDLGRVRLHEGFHNDKKFSPNSIYIIPASQTKGPFLKYTPPSGDQFSAEELVKFTFAKVEFKYEPSSKEAEFEFTPEDDEIFTNKEALFEAQETDL